MHETGHSKPVHWDNPEGGMGREVGGGFGMGGHVLFHGDPWLIHFNVWKKKKHYNIVK